MEGIIPVIKPPGVTSHDVVGMLRGILKTKRIGHSGTLDPMAAGVLPIYVGKATRLIEYGDENFKTYVAECQLGFGTDTEDITGNIISECPISKEDAPSWEVVEEACNKFIGKIMQRPSIYSAIKVNGRRAYELAREGIEFELPEREIEIKSMNLIAYSYPYFTVEVSCSTGTYIRALLRDICESLGQVGTMSALHRTEVSPYHISESYTIEEVRENAAGLLHNVDETVKHLPILKANQKEILDLCQGKRLSKYGRKESLGLYRLYEEDNFLGIVEVNEKCIKSNKILYFPKAMQ